MSTKYSVSIAPLYGSKYNPIHDELQGAIATNVELTVGERGSFLAECTNGESFSVSTSTVERVEKFENGDILFVTRNTIYTFIKIT